MANKPEFFEDQKAQSRVKSTIVVKYFKAWAKIMAGVVQGEADPRLAYIDLFCGPGKYEDGAVSTPLLILEHVIASPELRDKVIAVFNDAEKERTAELSDNVRALPGVATLKHSPMIRTGEVDDGLVHEFASINMVPAFSFIDPFGYKGVTLELLEALMKGWGSDMVLFFPFDRINAALTNPKVTKHVDGLFGKERADRLRELTSGMHPENREALIIEEFAEALRERGYTYIIPYVFEYEQRDRTSHYLIFVTKHPLGYNIMKDIMYKASADKNQGIARFGYVRSQADKTPLLSLLNRPLDDLCDELLEFFAGRTLTMEAIHREHQKAIGINPFIKKNYKDALNMLDAANKIVTNRPGRSKGTFADDIVVTFPRKEKK
ncbi:three-Cys-motif partner protein [Bradyrhizobium sp. USDA 326]|uniref:three-Cys-motif partner protein TcmP n=1 Tax=unclassified Bradyrhizobium TaxID=2631580 RepID=UPI003517520C